MGRLDFLAELGIEAENAGGYATEWCGAGGLLESVAPADESVIASVRQCDAGDYETIMANATRAFACWRLEPAPARGEVVRQLGNELRRHKVALGKLIAWEMGKIQAEGEGEVQEMIDIADFAVGLSRQLYGKTMHSERPRHRMYEQWHPLGIVGVITAFNFPGAVWAWNAMIAAVCGDVMVWKPSSKTPLTAIAIQHIVNRVLEPLEWNGVMSLLVGSSRDVGELLIHDRRVPLVSATGSCNMGRKVGEAVAKRLGRSLLELGGVMTLQATARARQAAGLAVTAPQVAGKMLYENILGYYGDTLSDIHEHGYAVVASETIEPYGNAIMKQFSSERETWTEKLFRGSARGLRRVFRMQTSK